MLMLFNLSLWIYSKFVRALKFEDTKHSLVKQSYLPLPFLNASNIWQGWQKSSIIVGNQGIARVWPEVFEVLTWLRAADESGEDDEGAESCQETHIAACHCWCACCAGLCQCEVVVAGGVKCLKAFSGSVTEKAELQLLK